MNNLSQPFKKLGLVAFEHASLSEYANFVETYIQSRPYANARETRCQFMLWYRQFVQRYADLGEWFSAPLLERVGRRFRENANHPICAASYRARHYLIFLALRGYISLDWEWLIATHHLVLEPFLPLLGGEEAAFSVLVAEAVNLGFEWKDAHMTLQWAVYRLLLHLATPHIADIRASHLIQFIAAVQNFKYRPDVDEFFGSSQRHQESIQPEHLTSIRLLQTVLYHRGQINTEPHRTTLSAPSRCPVKPQMEATVARYIQLRSLTDQPGTVKATKRYLLKFIDWIAQAYPLVEGWSEVSRNHLMEYAEELKTVHCTRGRPYAAQTKHGMLSGLSVFFQDTISWEWPDVPKRPPLQHGDLPKLPQSLPRYIPQHELERLMPAIRALECAYQKSALLVARWSGARREEIQRLTVDCLDRYPDGTARLRIPAGKTKQERMVPLNEEAAAAIVDLQTKRKGERGLVDRLTGIETRYLFIRHGKLISTKYLFEDSLDKVCAVAGLVTSDNKALVTAHRFRHTVGTQLAQGGARLRTIQKILGHESVEMSLVYIGLSDEDVRQDYQAVLGPEALIAGGGAALVRSGEFAASEINWLKSNFFKTELELGHCLRLPQEGPCQCELYLSCAKFVTSPEYVPRLRQRRKLELNLIEDASSQGWLREVERHQCTIARIEQLLGDLGENVEDLETEG